MEESVQYFTIQIKQQKKVMTTTNVEYTQVYFNVKLMVQNCNNIFYHKQIPSNKEIKFDKMLNNENFKKTVSKIMILVGKIIMSNQLEFI